METSFNQMLGSSLILSLWCNVHKTMSLLVYKQLLPQFIDFTFS